MEGSVDYEGPVIHSCNNDNDPTPSFERIGASLDHSRKAATQDESSRARLVPVKAGKAHKSPRMGLSSSCEMLRKVKASKQIT